MIRANRRRPWPVERTRAVYRNPDGTAGSYGIVEVGDAVAVVATDGETICLVRQYRPSWRRDVWELPCGGIHRGERPLQAARRELREETGITARSWKPAGVVRANDPVVNTFHVYLARGLKHGEAVRDASEADMTCKMWILRDLKRAVRNGIIDDDMTLACILKCLMIAGIRL
jgi:ADP-ribose pyrophosphatase YjhB (NUDIX family)